MMSVRATALLTAVLAGVAHAQPAALPLRFRSGQSWAALETAQTVDPASGILRSQQQTRLRFRVESAFKDGAALLSAVPVDAPGAERRHYLVSREGWIYMIAPEQVEALASSRTGQEWLSARTAAAVDWYKLPEGRLEVGMTERRSVGPQRWLLTRLKDETLAGVSCEVYRARLLGEGKEGTAETTWLDPAAGTVLKKEFVSRAPSSARRILLERVP